jgi:hypothetical protein
MGGIGQRAERLTPVGLWFARTTERSGKMGEKIAHLIPENNGNWDKFTVLIERRKLDGNYKLSINGEDSANGKTFRMGLSYEKTIESLAKLVTRMESAQLRA